MIQEYLFTDLEKYEDIEKYTPERVKIQICKIDNSECFIAKYSVDGENEESAKKLSMVDEYITKKYQPIVLANGSSAYYNQKLFPFINEFERKLRKLLYLKSALSKSKDSSQNIIDLENKNLGEIFEILFTDKTFINKVKAKLSNKSWNFTKRELISLAQSLSENTVWNALLGEDAVSELQERFIDVKNYRNDVMHAHNINTKAYHDSKKLFKDINNKLDKEINNIVFVYQDNQVDSNEREFNEVLSDALSSCNIDSIEKTDYISYTLNNGDYSSDVIQNQRGISNVLNYYSKMIENLKLQNNMNELLDKQHCFKDVVQQHAEVLKLFNENNSLSKVLKSRENYNEVLETYTNVIKGIGNINSVMCGLQKQDAILKNKE